MATKYKKWAKKRVHYRGLSHHSSQTSKKQWGQNFELCRGHLGGKTDSVGGHLGQTYKNVFKIGLTVNF